MHRKGWFAIERPEVLNHLDGQVFMELGRLSDAMERDNQERVAILTSEGEKAFAPGSDITEMQKYTVMEAREFAVAANSAQEKIEAFPKPVVAAIKDYTLEGRCELVTACLIYRNRQPVLRINKPTGE